MMNFSVVLFFKEEYFYNFCFAVRKEICSIDFLQFVMCSYSNTTSLYFFHAIIRSQVGRNDHKSLLGLVQISKYPMHFLPSFTSERRTVFLSEKACIKASQFTSYPPFRPNQISHPLVYLCVNGKVDIVYKH